MQQAPDLGLGQTQEQERMDVRLAVLETRMDGLERAGEHREERLCSVEKAILDLTSKIDGLTRAMGEMRSHLEDEMGALKTDLGKQMGGVRAAGWKQTVATITAVLLPMIALFYYLAQVLLGHVLATGGRP